MIKITNIEVEGWRAALRGMRNPLNSWDRADSKFDNGIELGAADLYLMKRLNNAGTDHAKFMRMITVSMDITAPLYWWKEYDTYKVGTVANSCSTMHKIHSKEFELDDFSHERMSGGALVALQSVIIPQLNEDLVEFVTTKDKQYWHNIIQLLPSSYNQKRTVLVNYAVLQRMYHARKNHKLDEWRDFCRQIEVLPFAKELIIGKSDNEEA